MKNYIKYTIIAVFIITFGALYSCERQDKRVDIVDTYQDEEKESTIMSVTDNYNTGGSLKDICVHVTGCVVAPGVYQLPEGSRVYEAIVLAGGFTEEADEEYLNQAAILSDGERIYIYSTEETATASDYTDKNISQDEDTLVNINTATKETLMTLPGIGESRAESIIAYREEYGVFRTIEDIMKVSGIKDAAYSKLKKYICVD